MALAAFQRDFRAGAFTSVSRGIADHVFDRAVQQTGHAHDRAIFLDHALHAAIAALGFEVGVGRDALDHLPKKDRRLLPRVASAFETGDGEQSADQFVQPFSFQIDAFERAVGFQRRTR